MDRRSSRYQPRWTVLTGNTQWNTKDYIERTEGKVTPAETAPREVRLYVSYVQNPRQAISDRIWYYLLVWRDRDTAVGSFLDSIRWCDWKVSWEWIETILFLGSQTWMRRSSLREITIESWWWWWWGLCWQGLMTDWGIGCHGNKITKAKAVRVLALHCGTKCLTLKKSLISETFFLRLRVRYCTSGVSEQSCGDASTICSCMRLSSPKRKRMTGSGQSL